MKTPASLKIKKPSGFTIIELLVVLLIISILASITLPRILELSRRNGIKNSAHAIISTWEKAQTMAMQQTQGSANAPKHWGVWIRQSEGKLTTVSLIYSNSTTPSTSDDTQRDIIELDTNSIIATQEGTGSQNHVWYAQFGTGLPIPAKAVQSGKSLYTSPIGIGVSTDEDLGISPIQILKVLSLDYDEDSQKGIGYDLKIYPVGISSIEESI